MLCDLLLVESLKQTRLLTVLLRATHHRYFRHIKSVSWSCDWTRSGRSLRFILAAFIQSKKLRAFESRLVIHKTQEYDSQLQQTDSQRIRRWKNQRGEYSRI